MRLNELFQHVGQTNSETDDVDWLGDLKFYIDNNDNMLEQHIFPAMKKHQKYANKTGTYKLYLEGIKSCLESYVEEYEIDESVIDEAFNDEAIESVAKHFADAQAAYIERGDYEKYKVTEDKQKHVTFCFGRMNPPTLGHKQLLDTCATGNDYKIFVSKTEGATPAKAKKDPLAYETKLHYIKEMFPEHAGNIVEDASLKTIMQIAVWLNEQGYTHATFVGGDDRLGQFGPMLEKYNGVESKHGMYKFESINTKSSGAREDGAEGVRGISASGARAAAAAGDFDEFKESVGDFKLIDSLYESVRDGMGIAESINEAKVGDKVSYTSLRSGKRKRTGTIANIRNKNGRTTYELDNGAIVDKNDIAEEFGVGLVTAQNTTKDVDKGTTKKNLRKYKL